MKFRLLSLLLIVCFSYSCNEPDRSAFEKASGITIPETATKKEAFDDGKLVKINSFGIDSTELIKFINDNGFTPFRNDNLPQFWGMNYLKEKPNLDNLGSFYYKSGSADSISWIYIADLKSGRLWTEIKYPGKPSY